MICPKCNKILSPVTYWEEEKDVFKVSSIEPDTIIKIPKQLYYCSKCQIQIEETLSAKYYKEI